MIIGIDIGGTFTDFAAIDDAGNVHVHKRLSTPADPARAVLDGLRELGAPPDAAIVHGSTIATNALLERKGARTALVTTRGFADVIEIGRQNRPQLYALEPLKPEPLVPRDLRFELDERIAADGSIVRSLDPAEVTALAGRLQETGVESIAVCFLFSFLHPDHERLVQRIISNLQSPPTTDVEDESQPRPFISLSCEILPEYREYERTSTTVINAYVAPLIARYLGRLEAALGGRRLRIAGLVTMDMIVVADHEWAPEPDAVATLVGSDGDDEITLDSFAAAADTISYDVLTGLGPRVLRVYG